MHHAKQRCFGRNERDHGFFFVPPLPARPQRQGFFALQGGLLPLLTRVLVVSFLMLACEFGKPAFAGYWAAETTSEGSVTVGNSTNTPTSTTHGWNDYDWHGSTADWDVGADITGTVGTSGTITVTLHWVPDPNIPNDKPPKKVWLAETASAGWTADNGPEGTFDGPVSVGLDGQGEETQTPFNGGYCFSGPYYKQITKFKMTEISVNANTVVTRSCVVGATVHANGKNFPPTEPGYPEGTLVPFRYESHLVASVSYSAAIMNKGVLISSDRDTTYGRGMQDGIPVAVPNFPDEDGTIHADCRGNSDNDVQEIYYNGNSYGGWAANSTYEWTWAMGLSLGSTPSGLSASGTWSPGWFGAGIPALELGYGAPQRGMPDTTEAIHLKSVDPADGVIAEADYFMRFHYEYDDFVIQNRTSGPDYPPPGAQPDVAPPGWNVGSSATENGTISMGKDWNLEVGGEASVEFGSGGEAFSKLLTMKGGFKVTAKRSWKVTDGVTYGKVPHGEIWYGYWAQPYEEANGTCSVWGDSGYMSDPPWSAREVQEGFRTCCLKQHIDNP